MKKILKIEDIDAGNRWAWIANVNGMGSLAEQENRVTPFIKHPKYHIFKEGDQTMHSAAENGSKKGPACAMVVVGVRVLGRPWGDAFELLAASGDYLYSISTKYLYNCNETSDFNKARKEYNKQVLIPARNALKDSGKRSGPKYKLDKEMLADIQLRRNSFVSLTQIRADILEQYGLPVSEATISRRTSPPVGKPIEGDK